MKTKRQWSLPLLLGLAVLGCSSTQESMSPDSPRNRTPSTPAEFRLPVAPSKEGGKLAFDKGIAAAKSGQYAVAARYFTEARKSDPYSPQVLFNLGLAHSKAGNELLAIPWLEAFLAVQPEAPNAGAVRAEIDRLEKTCSEKAARMFDGAAAAAEKLANPAKKKHALRDVQLARAESGDIEGSRVMFKAAEGREFNDQDLSSARKRFAVALADAGDVRRSQELISKLIETDQREVWQKYFWTLSRDGRATELTNLIEKLPASMESLRSDAYYSLAQLYLDQRDLIAMEAVLPRTGSGRDNLSAWLAWAKCAAGDLAGIRELAGQIQEPDAKARVLQYLAVMQLRTGDAAAAKQSAREILTLAVSEYSWTAMESRVVAAAVLGNIEGALSYSQQEFKGFQRVGMNPPGLWEQIVLIRGLSDDWTGAEGVITKVKAIQAPKEQYTEMPWSAGWPQAGMARALLWRGHPEKAHEWYRQVKPHLKGLLLSELVREYIRKGNLAAAEQAVWEITPEDYNYGYFQSYRPANAALVPVQMEALIQLAEEHVARQSTEEARRLLRHARLVAVAHSFTQDAGELLKTVAEFQARLGDSAGAEETDAWRPPPAALKWLQLATKLSIDRYTADLENGMREALKDEKPDAVPRQISWFVNSQIVSNLMRMRALRELP